MKDLKNNINFLSEFSLIGGKFIDLVGFIRYNNNGEEILSFGKYRGITLKQIWQKIKYFSWIQNAFHYIH